MMASVSTIKSKHDLFCPPKHIENIPDSSEATVSICSPLIIVILIFISYDFRPHVSICVNIASILGLLFICLCSYAVFGTIMYRLLVVELLLRFHHLFIDISFFIWRAAAQQWLCIYCYGICAGRIEVTQLDPRYSFLFLWSFSFFSLESFNRWQLCRVVVSFFFLFAFRIVSLICRSSFVIFFLVSLRFSSEFEMYNHEKRNKAKKKIAQKFAEKPAYTAYHKFDEILTRRSALSVAVTFQSSTHCSNATNMKKKHTENKEK